MSGEYLRPDLHLDPPFRNTAYAAYVSSLNVSIACQGHPATRPLADFGNAGLFYLCAIEPLFPSGAEILRSVARKLLTDSAHDDETVRNQSGRPLVPAWPVRETPLPDGHPPAGVAVQADARAGLTSSSPATINERRGTPPGAPNPSGSRIVATHPTTIGSSTGVIEPRAPAPNRRKLALLGLAATVSAGVVTFALVAKRGGGTSAPPPEVARQPIETPPSTAAPPAPTSVAPAPTAQAQPATTPAAPTTAVHAATTPDTTAPTSAAQPAPRERVIAAPPPHRTTPAPRSAPTVPMPPGAAAVSSERLKPKPSPKPTPNRASADSASTRSAGHHFDPNAVGGQEEE